MVIFVCRDDFDSIICGVYDAWMSRLGHSNVKLVLADTGNLEMFAEYREVEVSEEKIDKVIKAVRQKISAEAFKMIYKASLSWEEQKADWIYRFLIYGFHYGAGVTEFLQIPAVYEMFRLNRSVSGETHLMTEFVRFSEMKEGILLSTIGPKNDVLSLIAPHFADRLNSERWIIYDENRKKAAVHNPDAGWILLSTKDESWQDKLTSETDQNSYENLWKAFFDNIAIKERSNYVCQRGHLPLRFRKYMTEFS